MSGLTRRALIQRGLMGSLLLAVGGAGRLRREDRASWFLLLFVVVSYAVMANVRYGMNRSRRPR